MCGWFDDGRNLMASDSNLASLAVSFALQKVSLFVSSTTLYAFESTENEQTFLYSENLKTFHVSLI